MVKPTMGTVQQITKIMKSQGYSDKVIVNVIELYMR